MLTPRLTKIHMFRTTEEESRRCKAAAEKAGVTLSEFFREAVKRMVKRIEAEKGSAQCG